jgi:hypothetical protein
LGKVEAADATYDNLLVDTSGLNSGGITPGIQFGTGLSGEGVSSKRTAGGNQYGLDFYTWYAKRMSILQNGNVGIGTDNPQALLHVSGTTPNILMGDAQNSMLPGVIGGTISGGGRNGYNNRVTDNYGTVGGGDQNLAGDGNDGITTNHRYATVAGGSVNQALGEYSTVGGGYGNQAFDSCCTVGGGSENQASVSYSTVGGGQHNHASNGGTVAGGSYNQANGTNSMVPGGEENQAGGINSFAAGCRAKVLDTPVFHDGAFLFADYHDFDFNSVAANEFAARATGGVRFVTAIDGSGNPTATTVIDPNGQLGVGTTVPGFKIHVVGVVDPTSLTFDSYGTVASNIIGRRAEGTVGSPSHCLTDDALLVLNGRGYGATGFSNASRAAIRLLAAENWSDTAQGAYIRFETTPTGSTTKAERMRIAASGNVGIGVTNPTHQLELSQDSAAKPSTNTWTIFSDGRLKDPESIEPFTEGSEFIKQLPQPVWYRYTKESGLPSEARAVGWIAQDIAPVAPFMVRRTKQKLKRTDREETETLSLNTNELPYAMLNCIKQMLHTQEELIDKVERLEAKLRELEGSNAS